MVRCQMAATPYGVILSAMITGGVARASLDHRIGEPKLFMAGGRAALLARAQMAVNNFAAGCKI
jgi:hypothetical protein